jgi:hypothetical protein
LPNSVVTIVDAQWHGSDVVELTYKDASGALGNELVFRDRETTLSILTEGGDWSFTADGANFRLASSPEAIYQSLKRRRERLEKRLREEEILKRGSVIDIGLNKIVDVEDIEDDFDDISAEEREATEQ